MATSSFQGDEYSFNKPPPLDDNDSIDSSERDAPYVVTGDIDDDADFGTFGEAPLPTLDNDDPPNVDLGSEISCDQEATGSAKSIQEIPTVPEVENIDSLPKSSENEHSEAVQDIENDVGNIIAEQPSAPDEVAVEAAPVDFADQQWEADFDAFQSVLTTPLPENSETSTNFASESQLESHLTDEQALVNETRDVEVVDESQSATLFANNVHDDTNMPHHSEEPDQEEPLALPNQPEALANTDDLTEVDGAQQTTDDDFADFGDFGEFEEAADNVQPAEADATQLQTTPPAIDQESAAPVGSQIADQPASQTTDGAEQQLPLPPPSESQRQAANQLPPTVENRLRSVFERCFPVADPSGGTAQTDLTSTDTDPDRHVNVFDSEFAAPQRTIWRSALVVESSPATAFTWQQSNFNLLLMRSLKVDTRNLLISSRNIRVVPAYAKGLGTALQPSNSASEEPSRGAASQMQTQEYAAPTSLNGRPVVELEPVKGESSAKVLDFDTSKLERHVNHSNAAASRNQNISIEEFLELDVVNPSTQRGDTTRGVNVSGSGLSNEEAILAKIRTMTAGSGSGSTRDAPNTHSSALQNDAEAQARREAERIASRLPDLSFVRSVKLLNQ